MLYVSGNSLGRKYCYDNECRYTITDSETGRSYETDNPSGAYGVADRAVVSLDKWDIKLLDIIQSTEVVNHEGRGVARYLDEFYYLTLPMTFNQKGYFTVLGWLKYAKRFENRFRLDVCDIVIDYYCDMKEFGRFYAKYEVLTSNKDRKR